MGLLRKIRRRWRAMRHEHRDEDADALAAELRGETYELGSHRDVLREERPSAIIRRAAAGGSGPASLSLASA
jgi:hypothetical protein